MTAMAGVSAPLLLRECFALDDRTYAVLGEPWYDRDERMWRARLIYLPIDRSLPCSVEAVPLLHAERRDALARELRRITDDELSRTLRAVTLPLPHRPRAHSPAARSRGR